MKSRRSCSALDVKFTIIAATAWVRARCDPEGRRMRRLSALCSATRLLYDSEEGESLLVDFAHLSHLAVRLPDRGSIPYPRAFTGKVIVVSAKELT